VLIAFKSIFDPLIGMHDQIDEQTTTYIVGILIEIRKNRISSVGEIR